jgi:hypothetical protein
VASQRWVPLLGKAFSGDRDEQLLEMLKWMFEEHNPGNQQ